MTFINTMLLFAFLHVQSYCLNFCSCSCLFSSSARTAVVLPESGWFYPFEGMLWGVVISSIFYYRRWYSKKFISHEKLGLIQSVFSNTITPLILMHHYLKEVLEEDLPEASAFKLNQVLNHTIYLQECYGTVRAFDHENKKAHPHPQVMECELYNYISSVVNHCKVYASMRRIELELHETPGYVLCCMNAISMSAVLKELLEKMIDDTPSGGHINIAVSIGGDAWKLQFSNGLPEVTGYKSRLLYAISAYLPEYYWGSLQIAKRVIRLHDGKLKMHKCGKTSTFEIIIPIEGKSEPQDSERIEPAGVEKSEVSATLSRILLVMGDKELSDFLSERLAEDFCVTVLTDVEKVIPFCSCQVPDAILIDETVNGMEGDKLCSRLKSHGLFGGIPLLLLVNSGDDMKHIAYIGCGAEKVELRSVHVYRLKAEVHALIEHRLLEYKRVKGFLSNYSSDINKIKKEDKEAPFPERVKRCLETNFVGYNYTVEQFCSDMGMSRTSFYNKMKEIIGLSPETYILLFKMEKAKVLLATGRHTVSEVAGMVSFCDPKYFSKKFKGLYNVSPSHYMRSFTEQQTSVH